MNQVTTYSAGLAALVDKLLTSNIDLDKVDRVIEMQRDWEMREADKAFADAHTAAEAEMETIRTDANNPQTRSRYATFAQLDGAIRKIYTRHGFAISFTTEPTGTPDSILVVGTLSHRLGCSRRTQIPVPITTTGFKGTAMMTPVHATMSAISYGKRNIEILMFNLAIGEDDDGNAAGRRRPAPQPAPSRMQPIETIDRDTGEVTESIEPAAIVFEEADDWRSWGEKLMWGVRKSKDIDAVDQWLLLNQDLLLKLKEIKPALFKTLESAISNVKEQFTEGT